MTQPSLESSLEEEIAHLRSEVDSLQREIRTVQLVKNNGTAGMRMRIILERC